MTVKQRQLLLAYLGFYEGTADGQWGPESREAAVRFQQAYGGLTVDGIVGQNTEKALKQAVAEGMPEQTEDFWKSIRYFRREEFACKCGCYCNGYPKEMQELAVQLADRARGYFGRPAHISSGLRCPQHNANVGGVRNSQHLYGEAVDLRIEGVSAEKLLVYFQQQEEVRYAYKIDGSHIHFDIPKGDRQA